MAEHTGIEPVVFAVTGRRVNRYTNAPNFILPKTPETPFKPNLVIRLTSLWCPQKDLNLQPTDYKSVALPVEPWGRYTYNSTLDTT